MGRPRPVFQLLSSGALFVAAGALVAFGFAAGGAILVLAALGAAGACGLDGCERCHEGESDGGDNGFHDFSLCLEFRIGFAREKSGHGAKSGRDSRRGNGRSGAALVGALVLWIPTLVG